MLSDTLRQMITMKSFWVGVAHPELTKAEAQALAVEIVAQEQRERAKHERKPSAPVVPHAGKNGVAAAGAMLLWGKLTAMLDNLERRSAPKPTPPPDVEGTSPSHPYTTRTVEPEPTTPTLGQRITSAVRGLATQVGVASQPEPEPARPQPPLIRAENSSAVLIPESEFAPGMRSVVTENWRRSIQHNAEVYEFKRGGNPARKSWLIG